MSKDPEQRISINQILSLPALQEQAEKLNIFLDRKNTTKEHLQNGPV
jgi:hypothetical protein